MTRIIAGLAGSIRLKPAAKSTRPTSDRVKESLFARLEALDAIDNSRVLDLFAGTGALGLEALSRGAKTLMLVERDRSANQVCKENIEIFIKSIPDAQIKLENQDATKFLAKNGAVFDLVFVDPPYEFSDGAMREIFTGLIRALGKDALVVLERSARSETVNFEGFELLQEHGYGDTKVMIYSLV